MRRGPVARVLPLSVRPERLLGALSRSGCLSITGGKGDESPLSLADRCWGPAMCLLCAEPCQVQHLPSGDQTRPCSAAHVCGAHAAACYLMQGQLLASFCRHIWVHGARKLSG